MFLPNDIHAFSEPTLIVLADQVKAQFWMAHETEIEEVDAISVPRELKSDNEGSFVNTDNGSVSGMERTDEAHLHELIHAVTEKIEEISGEGTADHIHLVMEPRLLHAVKEHLSPETIAKCGREVPHQLMKDTIVDVVKRIRTL